MTCMMMRIPKQTNDFPMKFFRYLKLFILTSIFFGTCSHVFADYMSRMKERLPSLIDAKDQGIVGEGTDGFVYVRSGDSEKISKLVTSENADRKILFQSMALKTGGKVEEVATKFSKALVKKSKMGHWFRKSTGEWMQKK
ncbi:MAG: hypothetical protein CMI24_05960 [Opitutae bacterium]|nr:hypothetical protein [Opitutae bacterium]